MVLRRFGLVAALLAAVCCGALLAGCANSDNDENDNDYEEKKALDYWNKWYDADDYKWEDITDDNKDKIVGTWKAVNEMTSDCEDLDFIGYYTSMEFVIDDSFKNCKFTFISDSSKCKSKDFYTNAPLTFLLEFVNGEGYNFELDHKNYIATATAENLALKQLAEVLHCEGFSISTTGNRLLLRNRPEDARNLPATWLFATNNDASDLYGSSYVIARVE